MTKKAVGFHSEEKEDANKDYIGNYFVISFANSGNYYVGKIKNYENNQIVLNPFEGFRYNSEIKKNLYSLIYEDYFIKYNPAHGEPSLGPTNEETILENCKEKNRAIIQKNVQIIVVGKMNDLSDCIQKTR